MSKINQTLFGTHAHALAEAFGQCPDCGGQLHVRRGKKGPFIGCQEYPSCEYIRPLHDTETQTIKIIERSKCPECDSELAVKKGRYGLYIGCTNVSNCHYVSSLKQQSQTQIACPSCKKGILTERTNRFGKIFYSCNQYPRCKYAVNSKPIETECQKCGWGIMLHMKTTIVCPQPSCGHSYQEKNK